MIEIKFIKTHNDAKLPVKAYDSDNCFDLFAAEDVKIPSSYSSNNGNTEIGHSKVPTGIKVGYITPGYGLAIKPKSGLGFKHHLQPHLGEIDEGYRGSLGIKIYNFGDKDYIFKKGDKVAQIKIEKVYEVKVSWTNKTEESSRGENGFGSSGRQ